MNKKYTKPDDKSLKEKLTPTQYEVTQNNATERPFTSEYNNHNEQGIYVDIASGEPLFSSKHKFDAGCGWPSFSETIENDNIIENSDTSHGMIRTEVRSKHGNSHLGHLFDDGPKEMGGLRYCINGASLRFIKKEDLLKEGYGEYLEIFE